MLLEFKTKNYKSFKDETVFAMSPAPRLRGLDYSVMNERAGKKTVKALSAAVIYGPNAAGKTNLIGAMDTFRQIVLRGHIRDERTANPNLSAARLATIPFSRADESSPICFSIKFSENGMLVDYSLEFEVGKFLDDGFSRRIAIEVLRINEKTIFERDANDVEIHTSSVREFLNAGVAKNYENVAKGGLNVQELFLTNGFKNIYSQKLVSAILGWMRNKFLTVYHADFMQTAPYWEDLDEDSLAVLGKVSFVRDDNVAGMLNEFGAASEIGWRKGHGATPLRISKVGGAYISSEIYESFGTLRFMNEIPIVQNALKIGATLVVDEFDASIHPMAIMSIVNVFHNDEINKRHAQLIFNTHNPMFMNRGLFRRDEIKFVEMDDATKCSSHYSLSDFKAVDGGARMASDYMGNYFVGKYGAIRNIDFTDAFRRSQGGGAEDSTNE